MEVGMDGKNLRKDIFKMGNTKLGWKKKIEIKVKIWDWKLKFEIES